MRLRLLFTVWCCLTCLRVSSINEDLTAKIVKALSMTESSLRRLGKDWQVERYPLFLKSCSMHKSSFELMKLKFIERMLQAEEAKAKRPYVISFLGSSVAAGHDSHFNYSYPVVAGEMMAEAFDAMDVTIDARNMALGNNPCFPYDICVKIFANVDADMVHWEQTYNCGGKPILEQFVRQAMAIPTKPLLVFSESFTAHWAPDKCVAPPGSLSQIERDLLAALHSNGSTSGVVKIVAELNKDEFKRAWQSPLGEVSHRYRGAGLQTFTHMSHAPYACQGPYIKDWEKGAAAWHPSIVAHRLRAAHHAFFWLHGWKEALQDLRSLASHRPIDDIFKTVKHKISLVHTPLPERIHPSPVTDDVKCYSDYEPRGVREASLKDHVLSGLALAATAGSATTGGWKSVIYENLVHENLVKSALKMEYKDFKHLLYAEGRAAGRLDILIEPQKAGPMFVCETPGIWGALPEGFVHLWDAKPAIHLSPNVDPKGFKFDESKATALQFEHTKDLEICMQIKQDVGAGSHVLSVAPTGEDKIILAWIILP